VHRGKSHHHGGKTFVAGGYADDASTSRERANKPAEDDGRVVAIGEGIEHSNGALGTSVAGIADGTGEGNGAERSEFARGGFHHETDFPMAGVIAEGDGVAVGSAQSALSAEDKKLAAENVLWLPTHADALSQTEEITAGGCSQQFVRERELARGADCFRLEFKKRIAGGEEVGGDGHREELSYGRAVG
jgi:hypothetical protein